MANDGFYWFTDPGIIGQKFSVFAEELPFKLGTAVHRAINIAEEDIRARVLSLGRIRTGDMFSSIGSSMTITGGGRVAGNYGFINGAPFYTVFQEFGTSHGITAMHAFVDASVRLRTTLKEQIDVEDIWSNLR